MREAGGLKCDVCNFNYSAFYGNLGNDYIECHHLNPVSELKDGNKTKINDLALVCSNCHRMLHRKKPCLSVEELKEIVKTQQNKNNK
ncbi:HNH endonuclease [Cyanobacteria bacterium FACHB-472]|nr:HNH endonuclease [Cyanobacteria bacterium FACHB-472]